MKFKAPEAEILRTPIKIEKLSLRNRSGSGFTMNFEFHGFQKKNSFFFFLNFCFFICGDVTSIWNAVHSMEKRTKRPYGMGSMAWKGGRYVHMDSPM